MLTDSFRMRRVSASPPSPLTDPVVIPPRFNRLEFVQRLISVAVFRDC